jgi:hypothetical protein
MSSAALNALEREVELTRAKFADDLARLRSPENLARLKEDLWAHARERKDGIVADWKARAAANPLAVAALAAGVGWRLFHRPPIATLLVGLGLVGLLRTSPSPEDYANAEDLMDPSRWPAHAGDMADTAKQKVHEWARSASSGDSAAQPGRGVVRYRRRIFGELAHFQPGRIAGIMQPRPRHNAGITQRIGRTLPYRGSSLCNLRSRTACSIHCRLACLGAPGTDRRVTALRA